MTQWLKLGAASAGMGAALLGFSLMGPSTGTAAADSTTKSSASAPSDSDSSSDAGSSDAGSATDREDTETGDADESVEADDDNDARVDVDDAADEEDEDVVVADEDEVAGDTDDEEDRVQTHKSARVTTAPTAAPVEEEPQQPPAPPVKAPAWLAPRGTWDSNVAQIVDTWTTRNRAWIDALNISDARKADLEASFSQFKRAFLNQAPVLNPVQLTGLISGDITGKIEGTDADGDKITYRLVTGPRQGSVVINDDGTYIYTPGAKFDGVDTFRVVALDAGSNVNLLNPLRGVGTSAVGLINQNAIKFAFNYSGADWTPQRREALETVADSLLEYFRVDRPVTITYDVNLEDPTDPERGLASAGSDYISKLPGYWQTVVQHKLLTGRDVNGSKADGTISWNFADFSWALGEQVSVKEYDFTAVAIHELMHSFGFLSSLGAPKTNTDPNRGTFDRFIVTVRGSDAFVGTRWPTSNDPKLIGSDGGLYFGGPNAVMGYDGFLVPLFTPWVYRPGSSISHLDDLTFNGDKLKVMTAETPTGPSPRVFSAMEIGILKDLGYNVVLPQTPPYSAAALIGFVFLIRKRRQ